MLTREPGGTGVGASIRRLVLDPGPALLHPRTETLLVAADRAQHVAEVVGPALARGDDVVSDRYSGSTAAYQGWGRGLDVDELDRISAWAAAGLEPDLVFLLDMAPEAAAARRAVTPDRIEAAGQDFHQRVTAGYRALAAAAPDRWVVVHADAPVDRVAEAVWEAYERWRVRL